MTQTANHYDVLVVGDRPAGLITAALLASQRYRVALLRTVNLPLPNGEEIRIRPRQPTYWPDVFDLPYAAAVKQQLALTHSLRTALSSRPSSYQLIAEELRADVPSGFDHYPGDLARELGNLPELSGITAGLTNYSRGINELLPAAEPHFSMGLFDWFRLSRLRRPLASWIQQSAGSRNELAAMLEQAPYNVLFKGFSAFFARSLTQPSSPFWPRTLTFSQSDILNVGGVQNFNDLFVERLEKRGGRIIDEELTLNLEKTGKGFSLTTKKLGEISADICLHNMPVATLPLVRNTRATRKFLSRMADVCTPRYLQYHLTLHLRPDGIPEGMANVALVAPSLQEANLTDLLLVLRDPLRDISREVAVLDIIRLVDLQEDDLSARCAAVGENTMQRIAWLCPFIEQHIVKKYDQVLWLPEQTGLGMPVANSEIVFEVNPRNNVWPALLKSPKADDHFYVAAEELFAPLGPESFFAAGLNCASLIAKRHPLKGIG